MKKLLFNKKNTISLILGLIVLVVLLVTINFDKISQSLENTLNYINLSSERQELYNKMMISGIKIVKRSTGTTPFNSVSASDLNGNDISESDNYVRTSDKVHYVLEVAISPNNVDNSSSETSDLTGGIIKVKATLPNQTGGANLTWAEDAWMKNVVYNDDKTVITAEFHAPSTTDITASTQELSFSVLVGGYKKIVTSTMLPEFEVWMEGNSPDNTSSSITSMKVKDNQSPFLISGKPSYNVVLTPEHGTLKKGTKVINGTEVPGRYKNVSLGVALSKLEGMPDFRGVEYPNGEFNINLGLSYYYSIGGGAAYSLLTAGTTGAINSINGTTIQAYGINGKLNENFIPNYKSTATSDRLPYGELSLSTVKNSVVNSGEMSATISSNTLNVNFKNFAVGNTFPTMPANSASIDEFNGENGFFLSGVVELFVPFYGDQTQKNNYKLSVVAESATYKKENGTTESISKGTDSIADTNTTDNVQNITLENYLSSNYMEGLYLYDTSWKYLETTYKHYDDASRNIGEKFNLTTLYGLIDGDFEGGITTLLVWDASKIGIRSIGETWIYTSTTTSTDYNPSIENVKMTYGIYNTNPSTGLTDITEINNAIYSDFTWYDTYEEASTHGTVTAVYIDDPDMMGNKATRKYNNYFTILNKEENIGKTAVLRLKNYAYEDAARTIKKSFRTSAYTPTVYDENGRITSYESNWGIGKTILITANRASISIKSIENSEEKTTYDIQDGLVNYEITPTQTSTISGKIINETYVYVTLPKGLSYVDNSANKRPESVVANADGTTKITWLYKNWTANQAPPEYDKITFQAEISADTTNNHIYSTKAIIYSNEDLRDENLYRTSISEIKVVNLSGSQLSKKVNKKLVDKGEKIIVTTTVGNSSSSSDLRDVRVVELLPKDNKNDNIIKGSYELKITSLATNQKMYYSTKNIENLGLTYTNEKYSAQTVNLANGDWVEIGVGSTIPQNATIIVSHISGIATSSSINYTYEITTNNSKGGDTFYFDSYLSNSGTNVILKNNTLFSVVANRVIKGSVLKGDEDTTIPNGINVYLLDKNKNIIETKTLNNNNQYTFDSLLKGEYYVRFDIPNNYEVLNTLTNKADVNGLSSLITGQNSAVTSNYIEIPNIDMVLKRKDALLTVNHYIEGTTTKLSETETKNVHWGDAYTTSPATVNSNYELVATPSNASGTISGNVEVIYYYRLKSATLTVNHYIEGTTTKLSETETKNVHWGDTYTTSPATVDSNYELVATPANASGTISGNVEVIYYYRLKSATITVHHYIEGTTNKLADDVTINKKYTEKYTTSPATVNKNYELVATPANASGTVSGNVTVTYYYRLKSATITVHHYIEGTTTKLADDIVFTKKYTEKYTTSPATINSNYELVATPENASGTVSGNITVTYYYRLKSTSLTVHHYIEGTTTKLADSIVKSVHWGDEYETSPSDKVSNNYELVATPSNASGIISANSVIVTYYYRQKSATLTVHHYIEGTTTSLAADETSTVYWGNNYTTSKSNDVSSNYELASVKGTASGTVSGNIEVTYYYKLKTSTLTIKHLEYGTNKELAPKETKTLKYTNEYEMKESSSIPGNYEYHSKTDNYKGIVSSPTIEVIFYYQKKDSQLSSTITLSEPNEITSKNQNIDYKIDYSTTISDYRGNGTIKLVLSLPYNIIEENSSLNDGTYNKENKTITWTITKDDINAADESKTIDITKEVTIVFSNLVSTDRSMNVKVQGTIDLDNNSRTAEESVTTYLKIPGKIIVHHYVEGTTDKVVDDVESTGLVGDSYISEAIEKDGYILKKEPEDKNHIYQDDTLEVVYEYEKISFKIVTKVGSGKGNISGDETIYYGENSTNDNIIIKPAEGYQVYQIFVNNEEIPIDSCKNGCVLNSFVDVQEDKEIVVVFAEISDNPNTSSIIAAITIGGLTILATISVILIKKYKPLLRKI